MVASGNVGVLSGDQFLRLASIKTKTLFSIKVILSLKFWIIRFWVTTHYPSPVPIFCPKREVSVNVGLGEG